MRIKKSAGELVFDAFNYAGMIAIMLLVVFPFWNQLVTSVSGGYEAYESPLMMWPREISFDAYRVMVQYKTIWTGYFNSIVRMLLGTLLATFLTSLTAYPLSKRNLPFGGAVTTLIMITMLFHSGLIPNYLLVSGIGIIDTIWALVLPGMISAWNVFIMRNFFRSIPESLEESAVVDGASRIYIFLRIVLPLSVPVVATIALWSAVGHWNEWFSAMIYIRNMQNQVLQVIIREFVLLNKAETVDSLVRALSEQGGFTATKQLEAAVIMMSVIPMLIIYPFVQKYFVKGIMVGSIKG